MNADVLIEKLEIKLKRYYFIKTKQTSCDTKIIGLSKSINDVKLSFSFDEKAGIIYNINCVTIGFNELCDFTDEIKKLLED